MVTLDNVCIHFSGLQPCILPNHTFLYDWAPCGYVQWPEKTENEKLQVVLLVIFINNWQLSSALLESVFNITFPSMNSAGLVQLSIIWPVSLPEPKITDVWD